MRRGIVFALACALLALALVGCDGAIRLKDDDDGAGVTVAPGETLELVLTSNPTTGYSWGVVDVPDCLAQEGESEYDSDALPGMTGAGGEETWRFTATEPGEGTLRLEYRRPWEESDVVDAFEVEVVVE